MSPRASTAKPRPIVPVKLLPSLQPLTLPMIASAVLNGTSIDATLKGAVATMERERTMLRASQLTLSIADPDSELLRSPLLDQRIELKLPGAGTWVSERLRSIGGYSHDGYVLSIRFWDDGSAALKTVNAARRWSGARYDLEEFVTSVATETGKEIPGVTLRAVVPRPGEILSPVTPVVQRTLRKDDGSTTPVGRAGAGRGWPAGAAAKVTVQGVSADAAQVRAIDAILTEADRLGASTFVQAAAIACATQESVMGKATTSRSGQHHGFYHQSSAWGPEESLKDPAVGCRLFLTSAKGPGVNGWRAKYGSLRTVSGDMGQMIDGIQIAGTPRAFGQWKTEALRTVALWSGGSGERKIKRSATSSASTSDTTQTLKALHRPTEWRRGKTGAPESSWSMLDRYAKSFGRRRFVSEDRIVVADDDHLILAAPHQTLTLQDPNITARPTLDQDGPGGLETLDFTIAAAAWRTPPGGVIDLQGAGSAASGPWLVATVTDAADDHVVRVQLTQPATEDPDRQTRTIRTTTVATKGTTSTATGGAAKALEWAASKIGIREQGFNRGPGVEAIIRKAGGVVGQPYCGYFVQLALEAAGLNPPGLGAVFTSYTRSAARQTPFSGAGSAASAKPGDLAIQGGPTGHIEIVEKNDRSANTLTTIGGNTSLPNGGEGVARKTRPYSAITRIAHVRYDS